MQLTIHFTDHLSRSLVELCENYRLISESIRPIVSSVLYIYSGWKSNTRLNDFHKIISAKLGLTWFYNYMYFDRFKKKNYSDIESIRSKMYRMYVDSKFLERCKPICSRFSSATLYSHFLLYGRQVYGTLLIIVTTSSASQTTIC